MRLPALALFRPAHLLTLALTATATQAEPWQGELLGHPVRLEIPADFEAEPAYADANDASAIVEFLPPGDTLENWGQMLTLTSFLEASGQPADQAVMNTVNNLAAGYGNACPESFAAEDLGSPAVPGAEASFAAWLSCGEVAGQSRSESMAVLVLASGGKVFTLQWAERRTANPGPLPFDFNHWLPRLDAFMAVKL